MKPELKPCPFCNESKNLIVEHCEGTVIHPAYRVCCDNCGASTGYVDKANHAVNWNSRVPAEPVKVLSDEEVLKIAIDSGLACRDSMGDVVCAWREDADISEYLVENARALLAKYASPQPQQQEIDPVKVPSEEIIEAVKAYGMAYSLPNTTATELTIRLQGIRALLAKYSEQHRK